MPAFGRDGMLTDAQIAQVTQHVRSLAGKAKPNAAGAQIFADNCAACHGSNAQGLREFGAPNLVDAIGLYGPGADAIAKQVTNPSHGVMPAWGTRLDPATIKMLAAYVHSLGGGEDFKPPVPAISPPAPTAAPATVQAHEQP